MTIHVEPMAHWPMRTLSQQPTAEVFLSGTSGYERCLHRDRAQQQEAIDLGATFHDCDKLVVLGIGGSAMGLRALVDALADRREADRLVLLDHLDLGTLEHALDGAQGAKLGLMVISRSGTTLR